MIGYINEKGKNILWAIPLQPEGFRNFSKDDSRNGGYIFGQNVFHTRDIPITNIFRRKIGGSAEEILLGALSVLIIAVLSEIIQAILLHSRRTKTESQRGVQNAVLVDGFTHLRSMFAVIKNLRIKANSVPTLNRKRFLLGLLMFSIALALIAADILAVYLTQPYVVSSSDSEYNIKVSQPIGTNSGVGRAARRLSQERPCVTPIFTHGPQNRNFSVSACISYKKNEAHTGETDVIDQVTIGSWYHAAGSDHEISFGQAAINITTRAFLYFSENSTRRLLYETKDTEDLQYAKYLQSLFIHSCIEISCNQDPSKNCEQLVGELSNTTAIQEKEILLWSSREEDKIEVARGVVTTYSVNLTNNPYSTIDRGMFPLVSTAVMEEVQGPAKYALTSTDELQENVDGLLIEEGRVAGLWAMLIGFICVLFILIVLRFMLRPVSIGAMAWELANNEADAETDIMDMASRELSLKGKLDLRSCSSHSVGSHVNQPSPGSALEPLEEGFPKMLSSA